MPPRTDAEKAADDTRKSSAACSLWKATNKTVPRYGTTLDNAISVSIHAHGDGRLLFANLIQCGGDVAPLKDKRAVLGFRRLRPPAVSHRQ